MADTRLYHGGKPGLKRGDLVVPAPPHFVDGCPVCEAKKRGINTAIDPLRQHEDGVYLTSDREYARFYASKFPRGDLYVVTPVGDTVSSTEDPFPTVIASAATVVSVYQTCVELSWHDRRKLLRRWEVADQKSYGLLLGPAVLY